MTTRCTQRTARALLSRASDPPELRTDVVRSALSARFWTSERGQVIALHGIAMLVLIGMAAVVIDLGIFLSERRSLQSAADGAALAAARDLLADQDAAVEAAEEYLVLNGYALSDIAIELTPGYAGEPDHFEVKITNEDMPFVFGRALGFLVKDVQARAVSQIITDFGDEYAIFALNEDCSSDGVGVSGSNASFQGIVHANGPVTVSGQDHSFYPTTTFGCGFTENGGGHTYGYNPTYAPDREYPIPTYTFADFASPTSNCDFYFNQGNVNLKAQSGVWADPGKTQLLPGLYCFNGNVSLSGNDIQGNITFVAKGKITISGSGSMFDAFWTDPIEGIDILFFSEEGNSPKAIDVSGSGGGWNGIIFAPNGHAEVTGHSNHAFNGSIIADTVKMAGTGLTVTASPGATNSNPVIALVE